jgi:hypothetical protein
VCLGVYHCGSDDSQETDQASASASKVGINQPADCCVREHSSTEFRGCFASSHYSNFPLFLRRRIEVIAVAQLVEALRYKPEGRGFDS